MNYTCCYSERRVGNPNMLKNRVRWFHWMFCQQYFKFQHSWEKLRTFLHKVMFTMYDWSRRMILIGPLNIAFWRGTDEPFETIHSASTLLIIFTLSIFIQVGVQVAFRNKRPSGCLYYWIAYVGGFACILHTVSLWTLLNIYFPSVLDTTLEFAVPLFILIVMRFTVNISAPPMDLLSDNTNEKINYSTAFRTTEWGWPLGALEMTLYVLDCVFSVFVIGSLVVFVWRGAWTLLDLFLYPDDENMSAFSSLIIGYGVVLVTFALQAPMKRCCDWLTGFWRIAALDCYVLFSFTGTINLWRGIWMLLNLYLLPDEPVWSYVITHVFPFILLVLLNCSNSLLVRGVFIDGEEPGGKCVDFPTYYLRMFFQEQRKKKLLKQSQRMRISTLASKNDEFQKVEKRPQMSEVSKGHVTLDLPHVTRF